MAYTHTFEIIINGKNIQGEYCFRNGGYPRLKTEAELELEIRQMDAVKLLFDAIQNCASVCGTVEKIELKLKK